MYEKMYEQVKNRQYKYDNVVFIPSNELALSFSLNNYPSKLEQTVSADEYQWVISRVNSIISEEYIGYKLSSIQMFS